MSPASYRDDPDWLLAQAEYIYPDADDPDTATALRVQAAFRMCEIQKSYRDAPPVTRPSRLRV